MNGRTIYNVYDASGRLVHVRKMAGGGSPEERSDYVRAAGQSVARVVSGGPVYYSFPDHLGSPVTTLESLTGTSVTATHRERYTPYGIGLDAPSVLEDQADFTGHIHDNATGLSYMQARYYDPVLGRFLSHDPVTVFDTGDVRFFNRYAYAFNDPVNWVDPDGRSPGKALRFGYKILKNKGDLKKARKDTFLEIGESIGELVDGDVSIDDALALIDLLSPITTDEVGGLIKSSKSMAQNLKRKIGKNSVSIKTVKGETRVDLAGATHKGVETPHVQTKSKNTAPDGNIFLNKDSEVRAATKKDIRMAARVVGNRNKVEKP